MSFKITPNDLPNPDFDAKRQTPTNSGATSFYHNTATQNQQTFERLSHSLPAKADFPTTPEGFLSKVLTEQPIDKNLKTANKSIIINPDKSPDKMTAADYKKAFYRVLLTEAKQKNVSEKDLSLIMNLNEKEWTNFDIETLRREDARPGAMTVTVNRYSIELADRTAQAVSQYRQYQAGQLDKAINKGNNYATDAVGGFVQPLVNAPVNVVNGATEPLRAVERLTIGTQYIPEIPRMSAAERSEYWQKDGRSYANTGAEIGATILLGGAAGSKAAATQAGRVLLGIEAGYNIAAGGTGIDATKDGVDGNRYRQMPIIERVPRVVGGVLGAKHIINTEIATPTSMTNKAATKLEDVFGKPQTEMVTPEGLRVKVNTEEVSDNTFLSKAAKTQEAESLGRRDLESHEGVSGVKEGKQVGHTLLKHVGKSENWLQNRLLKETNTPSASSFHNEIVGNRTVGKFVKENREAIDQWLKGNSITPFKAVIDMNEDIGLIVNRSKKGTPLAAEKATKAEIAVVKDNSEFGWHLFTVKLQK